MTAYLEVMTGQFAGMAQAVRRGDVCRIGSAWQCEMVVPDDPSLGPTHLSVVVTQKGVRLFNLDNTGNTFVNEEPANDVLVKDRAWIVAGQTLFRLSVDDAMFVEPESAVDHLLAHFKQKQEPVYAVLDTSQNRHLRSLVESLGGEGLWGSYQEQRSLLSRPMLARLPMHFRQAARVIRSLWGQNRLVLLTSAASFEQLREHLRSLFVASPGRGVARMRVLGPTALKLNLEAAPSGELEDRFGPVTEFWIEGARPREAMRLFPSSARLRTDSLSLLPDELRVPIQAEIVAGDDALVTIEHHLPGSLQGLAEDERQAFVQESRKRAVALGMQGRAAMMQFAMLRLILGPEFDTASEVRQYLGSSEISPERSLDLFASAVNVPRGGARDLVS